MSTVKFTDDCILGDWGTTRLRLYLCRRGEIKEQKNGAGIASFAAVARVDTDPSTSPLATTLLEQTAAWRAMPGGKTIVLAGMVGSRNGMIEVPYASVPVDRDTWAKAAWSAPLADVKVTIATGLRYISNIGGDVMRGEETQIFGAMALNPQLAQGEHTLILPGTHSKWVDVRDGTIARFSTAMTGEIFALLRTHSTLLSAGSDKDTSQTLIDEAFDTGVRRSANRTTSGLLVNLFQARTVQLLEQRSRQWAESFLSGLLIGGEVATLSGAYSTGRGVYVIGESQLTKLYERAFAVRGITATPIGGDACVIAGLQTLRALQRGEAS